jgi:hypothetical protein
MSIRTNVTVLCDGPGNTGSAEKKGEGPFRRNVPCPTSASIDTTALDGVAQLPADWGHSLWVPGRVRRPEEETGPYSRAAQHRCPACAAAWRIRRKTHHLDDL